MKAVNIEWDVDHDCDEELDLPIEMHIPDEVANDPDEDAIGNWLSEQTGFCHYGFALVED